MSCVSFNDRLINNDSNEALLTVSVIRSSPFHHERRNVFSGFGAQLLLFPVDLLPRPASGSSDAAVRVAEHG
jgi:hypothetical protein